jgi:hypothetical protein
VWRIPTAGADRSLLTPCHDHAGRHARPPQRGSSRGQRQCDPVSPDARMPLVQAAQRIGGTVRFGRVSRAC